MYFRYLLSTLVLIVLLFLMVPISSSQPSLQEKPLTSGDEETIETGSLTLDHTLPTSDVTRQDIRPMTEGWNDLMTEDFEGLFPSTGWTVFDADGITNGDYYWDDDDYKFHGGNWSAWCANGGRNALDPALYYYPNNANSWMVYGPFDLSNYSDAELLFYYSNKSEKDYDYFWWTASTNGTNFYGTRVSGDSGGWKYVNFDLTNVPTLGDVTNDSYVWIAFVFQSDYSNVDVGAFVDDITLWAYQERSTAFLPLVLKEQSFDFKFRPIPDGYSFPNYGNDLHYWQDDLGVADLIHMFGAPQVCVSGSTPANCILSFNAEKWRQQILISANNGHCEGMAVTSLRFYRRWPYYTGKTMPGDFQSGAQQTYGLTLDQSIQNYIMYYYALQIVKEVREPRSWIQANYTPTQIFELIKHELDSGGNDPYTIGFWFYYGGGGHAITPYNVVDKGAGIYWLYVYDNNYPGQARYIQFNTNTNTWYYTSDYQGNAFTKNLTVTRLSWRNQEPFTSPWSVTGTKVEFFLTGGGDMLITNAAGQRIGYDPTTNQTVNEVKDAQIVYLTGDLSPMYLLPVQEPGQLYDVTVTGRGIAKEVDTNLVMVGPGYVVGFEDIRLQPDQDLKMALSADGRQLIFEAGQTAQPPREIKRRD